jgi:predicted glutamine amidotransferase
MCGICGIRRFGEEPITAEQIRILLVGNERRGNQATGLALQQMDGSIQVYKDDEPASRVVMDKAFGAFVDENLRPDTLCAIGHTRAATKGLTIYPKNNHPMWDEQTAVIHNGMINNDDFLFRDMKLERVADTDSDIFRAILSRDGLTRDGIQALNRVSGSAAIAALDTRYPGKLLLARSGNPIVLSTTEDHLLWSSEKGPIYDALRPFYKKWGIWQRRMKVENVGFCNMPNDTAWLITDKLREDEQGDPSFIEWHQAFKVAYTYTARTYEIHNNYNFRWSNDHKGTKAVVTRCKNCKTWLQIEPHMRSILDRIKCVTCGKMLREAK